MLDTTGVGLTDMLMRTDEALMSREKRLRAIPPLHRTSMVDHYRDAITRQFKLYVARIHRKYSIPHDPDRACDLQWIYLPKQRAPSLPNPTSSQLEEIKAEIIHFHLKVPIKPTSWSFRMTPWLRPNDAEYDLHYQPPSLGSIFNQAFVVFHQVKRRRTNWDWKLTIGRSCGSRISRTS